MNIKQLNASDAETYTVAELIEKMPDGVYVCESQPGDYILITADEDAFINIHREGVNTRHNLLREWSDLRYRKLAPGEKLTLEITA